MEHLKSLATTLTTLIVFISMANIILPKSSIKKHVKFVLSLIVLASMVIPITNFLSFSTNLDNYDLESMILDEDSYDSTLHESEYNNDFMLSSLEKSIKNSLTDKFSDNNFDVKIDGKIDIANANVDITKVLVEVSNKNQSKIQKVIIGDIDNNINNENDSFKNEIKDFLVKQLGVSEDVVKINYI